MPDYSRGVIYKICCKDTSITECYVGSTTQLIKRRYHHKKMCKDGKPIRVYNFIRESGGWDNWEVVPIEESAFETKTQMLLRERYWKEELSASLNMVNPGTIAYYGSKAEAEKHWRCNIDITKRKQSTKEWRLNNSENLKEYNTEWRNQNPEKIKKYQLDWKAKYNENKEIINETRRANYQANKDNINARRRELAAAKRAQKKQAETALD